MPNVLKAYLIWDHTNEEVWGQEFVYGTTNKDVAMNIIDDDQSGFLTWEEVGIVTIDTP